MNLTVEEEEEEEERWEGTHFIRAVVCFKIVINFLPPHMHTPTHTTPSTPPHTHTHTTPSTPPHTHRLVDGINVTTDEDHMWFVPLSSSSSSPPILTLTLGTPTPLLGLRVWNYNGSLEDSYSGVRLSRLLAGSCVDLSLPSFLASPCTSPPSSLPSPQVKVVHIFLDGRRISSEGGVLLRRGDADSYTIFNYHISVRTFPQL